MNIRSVLAFFVSLFLIQAVRAQDSAKHSRIEGPGNNSARIRDTVIMPKYARDGYIAINAGLGIPTGALAVSGCASTGSVFSITTAFPGIISHGGFAFKFDWGTNSLNKNQFQDTLQKDIGLSNISYTLNAPVQKYGYKTLLTGLYLTYPGKYITIDGRILGGVMKATVPAISFTMHDSAGNSGTVYEAETNAFAFAFDIGIEVRYHVKPKISVILSADYLHSVPSFLVVVTGAALTSTGSIIQEQGRQITGGDQPFDLYTISLGVGYTISAQKPAPPK